MLAAIVLWSSGQIWLTTVFTLALFSGYALGYYVTPDLDLIGITSDEGRMMRDLKILGVFLVMYWFPYAYIMRFIGIKGRRGHRNFFSHSHVGTAIRLCYALLPAAAPYWYFGRPLYGSWVVSAFIGAYVGLALADTIHYYMDRMWR